MSATPAEFSVRLIAHTTFTPPEDVDWRPDPSAGDAESLVEFSGRACYETWDRPNPHTATADAYVRHIMDVGHLSLLEHASASVYLRGVSRSCAQEIMRHRHFSFSQLSQRYVPSGDSRVVVPDSIAGDPDLEELFLRSTGVARDAYEELLVALEEKFAGESNTVLRAKQARQAARSVLPNATETRFVMTGNLRSWRHFIAMRAAEHADPEIRGVAVACLHLLNELSPGIFSDFTVTRLRDGSETATSPYVADM
ncbi:Flavin-dependent thymidylate synthase [Corynebacterium provencense]|uniref:Flavin-dependent thymidylate synthase n=1 Tax=Corynebacterium provencense TaxID=1737425 RepID=A0A2Z3YNP3_9CORY|nr:MULTISPECIES: FAD-dependent thymidylate synthase [Corynebacterium]AWT26018.1 Flavin-dependent thymidylate synthase [Corynebacterium provencense]MCI1256017.1 FAD-dependent thymidylate synthase [Corynebacterium provencense]